MSEAMRKRYVADQILTASPERLVTMMYDALASSLVQADAAIGRSDSFEANAALIKAQNIVLELQSSLNVEVWDGAPGLLAIYHYLYKNLVRANLVKDRVLVAEALRLVQPLQAAWHQAAATLATERSAATV